MKIGDLVQNTLRGKIIDCGAIGIIVGWARHIVDDERVYLPVVYWSQIQDELAEMPEDLHIISEKL